MSHVSGFYGPTPTQSTIDPAAMKAYTKRFWPSLALHTAMSGWLDQYIHDPANRPAIGACVLAQLLAWADAGALLGRIDENTPPGRRQAVMIGVWQLTSIVHGMLLIDEAHLQPVEHQAVVDGWLRRLARNIIAEFTPPEEPRSAKLQWLDMTANHSHWAALAVGLIGVRLDDRDMFRFAIDELRRALAQVERDGALLREMRRGERAVHYQNFALQPIAALVALARANAVALSEDEERRLERLAAFTLAVTLDPAQAVRRTGRTQVSAEASLGWIDVLLPNLREHSASLTGRLEATAKSRRPFFIQFLGGPVSALYNPKAP